MSPACFVTPACAAASSHPARSQATRAQGVPRRAALCLLAGVAGGAVLLPHAPAPALADEAAGALPPGALHFNQVLATQRQWSSVSAAFADGRVPEPDEWTGLRALLRSVYGSSADMEFLARRWRSRDARDKGLDVAKRFRDAVKGLDVPAKAADTPAFLDGHAKVAVLLAEFFAVLAEDSVGDMPAEL